jgi:predicted GNAT family acetyltransferase
MSFRVRAERRAVNAQDVIPNRREAAVRNQLFGQAQEVFMHPLDNVIWQALTTRQAHVAEACGTARRFLREITLLSGFAEPNDEGYASLAKLAGTGGTAAVFLEEAYRPRAGWEYVAGAPLLQMVAENGAAGSHATESHAAIVELGDADSPEMIALTSLTNPGPFGPRTHELGNYVGIRDGGKLVAMAGQRLQVAGYTEVSAVCTHPEHTGKGYAALLMSEVMRRIRERGETPMLHTRAENQRAVSLYERLGFRTRLRGHFAVLRKL